jgi:hypothetical protein
LLTGINTYTVEENFVKRLMNDRPLFQKNGGNEKAGDAFLRL